MPDLSLHDQGDDPEVQRVQRAVGGMRDLMEMRMREGFWPVPGRKQLLQSPIWHDPRVATSPVHMGKMFFLWKEKGYQQAIGTTNTQPANELKDATGSYNPGGLLQWMDLDLMMFLSALFTDRQDKIIDADQRNIFDAIGYQRLDDPPYHELRSSIKRLTGTQIWDFEESTQGEIQYNLLPPLLITTDQEKRLWVKDGRRVRLVVAIGSGWVSEVRSDNQVVDLNSYLYLVREIRNGDATRRKLAQKNFAAKQVRATKEGPDEDWRDIDRPPDMSRSVLLFCDSLRRQQNDKSFLTVAKTDWLMERFADRHTPIPYVTSSLDLDKKVKLLGNELELSQSRKVKEFFGDHRRPDFKYLDLLHENGRVRRSLDALTKLRIFKHYQVDGDKLIIEWNDPKNLPRLEVRNRALTWNDSARTQIGYSSGIQQKIIVRDKLTGSLHFMEAEGAVLDDIAPISPPSPENAEPAQIPRKPVKMDEIKKGRGSSLEVLDLEGMTVEQIANLRRLHTHFALAPKQLKDAAAAGWTAKLVYQLFILVLWKQRQNEIRNHVAFAVSELANADPQKYTAETILLQHGDEMVARMRGWIFGSGGPLAPSEKPPVVPPQAVLRAPEPPVLQTENRPSPIGPSVRTAPQAPRSIAEVSSLLMELVMPVLKRRLREVRKAIDAPTGIAEPSKTSAPLIAEREELVEALETLGGVLSKPDSGTIATIRETMVELLTAAHQDVRDAASSFMARFPTPE